MESKLSKTAFEEEVLRTKQQKKEHRLTSFPGSFLFPSLFALRKQRDPGNELTRRPLHQPLLRFTQSAKSISKLLRLNCTTRESSFKFQFDLDYCQALFHEPVAQEIAEALPDLLTLNNLLYLVYVLSVELELAVRVDAGEGHLKIFAFECFPQHVPLLLLIISLRSWFK